MTAPHRRTALFLIVATIGIMSLVLVVLSPLALRWLASIHNTNWTELGNIGQTYGAVSALLAALALVGVSLSVLFQVREARASRIEAGRTRHFELTKMLLDDPFFFQVESLPDLTDVDTKRLTAYANLRVQFWQMLWDFGELSETELRMYLGPGLFTTDIGRRYWEHAHLRERAGHQTRKRREFFRVLDEAYMESACQESTVVAGPQTATLPVKVAQTTRGALLETVRIGALFAAGVALGIVFRRATGRRKAQCPLRSGVRE